MGQYPSANAVNFLTCSLGVVQETGWVFGVDNRIAGFRIGGSSKSGGSGDGNSDSSNNNTNGNNNRNGEG
jgi:hypothetical protein